MALWHTIPIDQQPSLSTKDWSAINLPDGERHSQPRGCVRKSCRYSVRVSRPDR